MDPRTAAPQLPLHLTSLAILSPSNAPLFVRSFTGPDDESRHYHLAHSAVDVIEERIIMNSTPNKPADAYLGLLFCMEDMAFYGFQSASKIRIVISVALVDALIKDSDIASIFRAIYHLFLTALNNPFLSLPTDFKAKPARPTRPDQAEAHDAAAGTEPDDPIPLNPLGEDMFRTGPEEIKPEWLSGNKRFCNGIDRIGDMLNGGR